MIIECVNVETGVFFIWDYEDMSLKEARSENGDGNILMLKSKRGLDIIDYFESQNRNFKKSYKIVEHYLMPNHVKDEDELLMSEAMKELNRRFGR